MISGWALLGPGGFGVLFVCTAALNDEGAEAGLQNTISIGFAGFASLLVTACQVAIT